MTRIDHIYIDGEFVVPHGEELFDLHDPTAGAVIGQVRLGDAEDARAAVRAGKAAAWAMAQTSKAKRLEMLGSLSDAVAERRADLIEAIMLEFGAPRALAGWMADGAAGAFRAAAESLRDYPLTQIVGAARVVMAPVGVAGLITPWNANPLFICNKLAYALAAGCPAVIKPGEMSAIQTEVVVRALDRARLPRGSFNVVNGRGDVVGHEIVVSPDVSKISFTGSTIVGKQLLRSAADTLKRVTLELGGKSPTIVLDDADLETAVDGVIGAGFINTGQACIAGTRVLVSARRQAEFEAKLVARIADTVKVGDPRTSSTTMGPLVSRAQWERVQRYIRLGVEEGAKLLIGGEGRPDGLAGNFVLPTVFTGVRNGMRIAQEEIFGPVLCVLAYRDEAEAVRIANDTSYGLSAYVFGERAHAEAIAAQLESGRVVINDGAEEVLAPFGGVKQSGLGRENGVAGLVGYLEPKTYLGCAAA